MWLIFRNVSQSVHGIGSIPSFINAILAVFEVVPGFPLDGGRVLRSIVWAFTRNLRTTTRVASLGGRMVAFLLILLSISQLFRGLLLNGLWFIFIGWFLHSAVVKGCHQAIALGMLRGLRAEDLMARDFVTVVSDFPSSKLVDEYMLGKCAYAFLVVDNGQLKGIVCLGDVKGIT